MAARTVAVWVLSLCSLGPCWVGLCASAGCVTARVDPALYQAQTFALASVHARSDVWLDGPGVMTPSLQNELGTEVIEMTLADTEDDAARLFGVEKVVGLDVVTKERAARELPEAQPLEDWSQVGDIVAVDLDAARTPAALGALASALHVDAAVVLRHEWSVTPNRIEVGSGLTAFDRCRLYVVDAHGRVLVDDVVVASAPLVAVGVEPRMFGVHAAAFGDEIRVLARRTARECIDMFKRRLTQARPARHAASKG